MPYKVFLVEDEIITREGIRDNVDWKSAGFEFCGEAPDGEIALPLIEASQPDVLITDIKMPFMDGLQLSKIIQKHMPWIKVIILSGHDEFEYAQSAVKLGVTEYLLKPVSAQDLSTALGNLSATLDREKQERETLKGLQNKVKDNLAPAQEKFLLRLVSGGVSSADAVEQSQQLGLDIVAIKASGVKFADLKPESMIVLDLDGRVIDGTLKPSSDTASHLCIYKHRPDVYGIVHTHSNYATAFATVGKPIPVYLTAQADEFGGPIPCGGFALIGGEQVGQAVIEAIGASPAVLLKNHGVFTVGPSGEAALKAAVMVEDIARTVWMALQIGQPDEIPEGLINKLNERYRNEYGQ